MYEHTHIHISVVFTVEKKRRQSLTVKRMKNPDVLQMRGGLGWGGGSSVLNINLPDENSGRSELPPPLSLSFSQRRPRLLAAAKRSWQHIFPACCRTSKTRVLAP